MKRFLSLAASLAEDRETLEFVYEPYLIQEGFLIRTPRGDIVHGEFFTHLFYGRNDIRQFQVHQTALDRLVVRYVPIGEPSKAFIDELPAIIRARLGENVRVLMEHCAQIPVPPSGKHRFTISDVRIGEERDEAPAEALPLSPKGRGSD